MEDFGAVATPARGFAASARDVDIYTRTHTHRYTRRTSESGTEGEGECARKRGGRVELPAARAF